MQKHCSVAAATLHGIEAIPVQVEVSVAPGLPGISIVGLPDSSVQESRLRVKAAIKATGFEVPAANIVVNLAPSSVRKAGSGFDLPIALGILVGTGQVPDSVLDGNTFVGELSLDGDIRGVHGLLAVAVMVSKLGGSLVTGETTDDLSLALPGRHRIVSNLNRFRRRDFFEPARPKGSQEASCDSNRGYTANLDYSDVASQDYAKRALQIAAAGQHSILMVGPPGSGKTMLARRMPSIMPLLEDEERLETALIHSVAGLDFDTILAGQRPFRSPHHSATPAGIMGGGTPLTPGEVSLSHNGILFLDEMPEFSNRVLQMLRQPLESGEVSLARADGVYRFPANFLLVGAANPCPCGYLGDPEKQCTCSEGMITHYQSKLGGPLIDRFDMMVNVNRSDPKTVLETGTGTSSSQLLQGVLAAREFAKYRNERFSDEMSDALGSSSAGHMKGKDSILIKQCGLQEEEHRFMEDVARAHTLSGRGIMKVLKVARTIADMEQEDRVTTDHIAEAVMFRMQDKG